MKKPQVILAVLGLALAAVAAWYVQRQPASAVSGPLASPPSDAGSAKGGPAGSGSGPSLAGGGAAKSGPGGPGSAAPGGPGAGGPATVEVGKAQATRIEDDVQAVGTLRARRSVVLRPEVSGRVASLGFQDGGRVRKGQLLLQLDDTLQAAQLKQAQAQAGIARTNLQRSRELAAQNFVSQSAVDQNAAALDVAQAQVALAQAQISRMSVTAPFDAVVGIRTVNVGDYLKDGADVVTLEDVGSVFLDFRLPERHVPQIKPGRQVEAQLDALPGRRFSGVVTALDSQVDANGRSLLVRAELRNNDGALRPGMFARARVVFAVREKAVLVPEEALLPLGGKQYLFKVVQGPKGAMSQRLEARIGVRVPGKVEILEGLADGDIVVTAGHARLARADSVPVRVVDIDKPQGPGRAPGEGGKAMPAGAAADKPGAAAGPGGGPGNGARPASGPVMARPAP
jgi:membrane fusion protein, multidrug efflux system